MRDFDGMVQGDGGEPQEEGPYLPRGSATACLKVVKEYIHRIAGPGWTPALYEPGHEGPYWNISLEGADDWALRITEDKLIEWPKGVFIEPAYSWCLALHPA